MDERLAKALDVSKALETHQNQKNILNKQYKDNLIYYFDGHKLSVNLSIITYCMSMESQFVLVDDNNTPFLVSNPSDFTKNIRAIYDTATRKYLMEFNKIKSKRSVGDLLDL